MITVNVLRDDKLIENIYKNFTNIDFSKELNIIADLVFEDYNENFEAEGRPKWIPSLLVRKGVQSKTLQKTGALKKSFSKHDINNIFRVTNTVLEIGTRISYSTMHNEGSPKYLAFNKFNLPQRIHTNVREGLSNTARDIISKKVTNVLSNI